jgi:hypothetical protein
MRSMMNKAQQQRAFTKGILKEDPIMSMRYKFLLEENKVSVDGGYSSNIDVSLLGFNGGFSLI